MSLFSLKSLMLTLALVSMTGCLLPRPPRGEVIESIQRHSSQPFETITLRPYDLASLRGNDRGGLAPRRPKRNVLFAAVDETVQVQFAERLRQVYRSDEDIRLEDVTWWRFAPLMRGLYNKIIKIPTHGLNDQSLTKAILELERLGEPYDIMLLTHGIPNHITGSNGQGFISYKTIAELPELKNLRLVFMQGCFSETLARDWMLMGAREVLSYEGWNRNFFFVDFFLKAYRKNLNVKKSYEEVLETIEEKMGNSLLYSKILEELSLTLEEYLEISPPPIYDSRQ
jgi:hypothetical protein